MKLRNKKTREIRECRDILLDGMFTVNSLAELCDEWEDYKEPKVYYYITDYGTICECEIGKFPLTESSRKRIGNYFETKEDAEIVFTSVRSIIRS